MVSIPTDRGSRSTVRRRWRSQRASEERWAYLFLAPWLIGFVVFTAGAMIYSLGVSFWETNFLNKSEFVGFANYQRMGDDPLFWKSLRVTCLYTVLTVPFATINVSSVPVSDCAFFGN